MSNQTRQLCSWISVLLEVVVQSLRTSACWSRHNPRLFIPTVLNYSETLLSVQEMCFKAKEQLAQPPFEFNQKTENRAAWEQLYLLWSLCVSRTLWWWVAWEVFSLCLLLVQPKSKSYQYRGASVGVSWSHEGLDIMKLCQSLPSCKVIVAFLSPCHLVHFCVPLYSTSMLLTSAGWVPFALERFVFWLLPQLLPYLTHVGKSK